MAGWWYTYPSEKYEFVSWGYYSQSMEKEKMFQTTNQKNMERTTQQIHRNNQETKNDVNIWSPIPGNFNMESDDQRLEKKESWGL